jgi:predicted Fe-Mo cluster-binding NifX family protein
MRIAIVTNKGGLDDLVADRFGRAQTYTIVELDDDSYEIKNVYVVENPGSRAASGAGVKAVQKLVDEHVDIVVGPQPGPNAYMALEQSGIKVYVYTGVKAREALEKVLEELRKK